MNVIEFRAAVRRDEELLHTGKAPAGTLACTGSDIPLRGIVTRNHLCGGERLCSDCYFGSIGRELDVNPIGALRITRGC